MATDYTSFFAQTDPRIQQIQQQKALAEQLMAQGNAPIDPNRSSGRYIVPVSPFEGLAKMGQSLAGAYIQKQNMEKTKELNDSLGKSYANIMTAQPLPWSKDQSQTGAMATSAANETMTNPMMAALANELRGKQADMADRAFQPLTPAEKMTFDLKKQDMANDAAYKKEYLGLLGQKISAADDARDNKISYRDEIRMAKSEEAAQAAQGVEQLMGEAEGILNKYETSKAAPLVGGFGQAINAIGLADADTKARVKDYESLSKISKDLGIQTLKQFGGNDTDKELQISIQSNIDPEALVETNMETIKRKIAAAKILQDKPDFEAQWVAKNGGLNKIDRDNGKSFGANWLAYQRQSWKDTMGDKGDGTSPANPVNLPGASDQPSATKTINYIIKDGKLVPEQ